jgi:hypothetical protein
MNISKEFFSRLDRLRSGDGSGRKKIIIGIATGIILLLTSIIIISNFQMEKDPSTKRINMMPKKRAPKKTLDYDFVKVDTIAIPTFPRAEQPQPAEPLPLAEKPEKTPPAKPKRTTPQTTAPTFKTSPAPQTTYPNAGNRGSSNMIVTNNLEQNQVRQAGPTGFFGRDAALVKVVLQNTTEASNGSLVEARVLNDSKWGDVKIPRRSKIIGIASLINGRVNIDFQQIVINDSTRSCNGQAYDLKKQRGLPYSQIPSEAEEIALQELQSATAGIPVVGSVTARASRTGNLNQETTKLDEGLEFYAWINSIL